MTAKTVRFLVASVAICVGILGVSQALAADTYQIDPVHSSFLFRIKHMGVSYTNGRFNQCSGNFVLDEADPSKDSIEVAVKTASLDTAVEARDKDLKSDKYFDVEKYPEMTFKSKTFKKNGDADFDVTGDLTIHGVTKQVTVKAQFVGKGKGMRGDERAGWEATFTIDRKDYGMTTMPDMIGSEVTIRVGVEGIKK